LNRFSELEFGELTRVAWEGCFGGLDQSDGGAADCLSQKGFSVATHTLADGVEVDVYNLHAEAGSTPEDRALSAADFVQLAAFVQQHSDGRAVILGGDTNLHTDRPEHDATWSTFREETGLIDVCTTLDCGADDNQIDKFAYRDGGGVSLTPLEHHFERAKFVRPDGGPLSDHDALAVRFEWSVAGP
jgi:hypothetical protein